VLKLCWFKCIFDLNVCAVLIQDINVLITQTNAIVYHIFREGN